MHMYTYGYTRISGGDGSGNLILSFGHSQKSYSVHAHRAQFSQVQLRTDVIEQWCRYRKKVPTGAVLEEST